MARGLQLAHPRVRRLAIQHVAVRVGDHGRVEGALGAALKLDGVHARGRKVVQVIQHLQVVAAQNVAEAAILLHGHAASLGLLLLHQGPVPAARLRARAEVGRTVQPHQLGREQAAARHRHAHGAVGKDLKLKAGKPVRVQLAPHARNLLQRELPRQNHARGPQARILFRRACIHDRCLRGDVQLHVRGILTQHGHRAQVRHNGRVHANGVNKPQVIGHAREVGIQHQRVERQVNRRAHRVGQLHRLLQFRAREVLAACTHAPLVTREVDLVCTKMQRHLQLFHAASWGEQLHLLHAHPLTRRPIGHALPQRWSARNGLGRAQFLLAVSVRARTRSLPTQTRLRRGTWANPGPPS